jgi:nitrite reductase (NADH) small subunit/3-phenylpropionate/trans-cinnamate dioxygenase ferredoxin subunit
VSAERFQTLARVGEIPEGEGRPFEVDGRIVAVFLDQGNYYAMDDTCPHQGAPLSDGMLCEKTVTCSWHGWRFSLEDGRWLDSPKGGTRVDTYPVRVVGDEIQVAVE